MDRHVIETCFWDKEELRQEIVVCLEGKNGEFAALDLVGGRLMNDIASQRIPKLTSLALLKQVPQVRRPEYVDRAIQVFAGARSYNDGNVFAASLILPLASQLTAEQIIHVANVFLNNGQLNGSSGTLDVIAEICRQNDRYKEETREIWIKIYKKLGISGRERYDDNDIPLEDSHFFFNIIEHRYPEVVNLIQKREK